MATTKKLERYILMVLPRKASGALAANLLVTLDTGADADGFSVKQVGALDDAPFGVCDDSWADGQQAGVIRKGIAPIICADASIAPQTPVYNDAAGKVTSTQGAGATLVGTALTSTSGADQLVSVDLAL